MDSRTRCILPFLALFLLAASGCAEQATKLGRDAPLTYWSAEDFAGRLRMRVTQQGPLGVTMTDGRRNVTIFTGADGYIYVDGQKLGQPGNAFYQNGKVYVLAAREPLVRWELQRLMPTQPPPGPPPPKPGGPIHATIVVDAGHGGKDPGTLGRGRSPLPESDIVLDIARNLARYLSQRQAKVIMTRKGDTFVELDDRCAIAEQARADLFVSIHVDSATRADAAGATIYVGRTASSDSEQAARSIEAALLKSGVECNGMQHKRLRVCDGHSRPAVLVECGFLTNTADARRLNSPEYRAAIAMAIADGIGNYFAR